jgi:hypothetical protein
VKHIDECSPEWIGEKILSVDLLPYENDAAVDECYFKTFEQDNGWRVVFGKGGGPDSMMRNQRRGVEEAKHDWLLLCEDDTYILKMPGADLINRLDMKGAPFLIYNGHWRRADDIVYWNNHMSYEPSDDEEDVILIKKPHHRDNYYVYGRIDESY